MKLLRPTFREVVVMSFFVNILALAVPVFVMQVYDRVLSSGGISTLQGLVVGVGVILLFDYVLRQSRARIMQTVALRVDVLVGRQLFEKITALPLQMLESKPAGYWQSLFRDVDVVRNTLSGAAALLVADLPFAVLFLVLAFTIAQPIAWVFLVIMPLFMLVAWRSAGVMNDANKAERQSTLSRDALVAEIIAGRTTVKALGLDQAMRPIWEDKHAENIEASIQRGAKTDGYANLGQTLTLVTSVVLTTVGSIAIIGQHLTMGALIATNMLSSRLLGPLNQLVGQWRAYSSFRQSVERLGEIFEASADRRESEVKLQRPKGNITLENVTYAYSEGAKPVVEGVQLSIKAGGIHALVGRNGSGKTTLLKLIQGLYKPKSGRVLLDGADIGQFGRYELADWIGYVPQECVLFQGTVRANIAHRHPDASDEEIVRAATQAGVHEFIIDLPDGYASDIGEAGRRLSGGQRQRIAVARALIGDPPVLLLDEPSSSLDRQAEIELRDTLVALSAERTVIIVTHSPIMLAACDNLVALDGGRVAISGPAKDILPKIFGGTVTPRGPRPVGGDPAQFRGRPATSPGGEDGGNVTGFRRVP
ncbi:MAG: ATP-binding cassette domain-containing protein [Magnetospirillum sp. WYHS-4]